jgi:hypothetical protein
MELQQELSAFYAKHGFGEAIGARALTVPVYTGCLLVPLPNIEARHRYLKYHDLHHLITRYSVGRIGEGEVSAWELGTGSLLASPTLAFMNLIALSTGLVLEPGRMLRAFVRGTRSSNLYSHRFVLGARFIEFGCYAAAALVIHSLIAIPALIARLITDIGLGYSFFQVIKPTKRTDLF